MKFNEILSVVLIVLGILITIVGVLNILSFNNSSQIDSRPDASSKPVPAEMGGTPWPPHIGSGNCPFGSNN